MNLKLREEAWTEQHGGGSGNPKNDRKNYRECKVWYLGAQCSSAEGPKEHRRLRQSQSGKSQKGRRRSKEGWSQKSQAAGKL